MIARRRLIHNIVDRVASGIAPLTINNARELVGVKLYGKCEQGSLPPTPDNHVDIVCNNGVLKARHQSGLPLGYTLLEYIENTGTQWIDTGILLSNTDVFEITFQSLNSLESSIMGAISGGTSYTSTGNISVTYNITSHISTYSVYCDGAVGNAYYSWNGGNRADGLKHTIKYIGLNIAPTLDSVPMTQISEKTLIENTPTVTTWLFGRNNTSTGTLSQSGVRIYDVYIQGKGHFIPAKRNSDNVLGMYDLVSGQFFTNQGTGDFIAGNEVSDPVEICTDGTVETINVHGKNLYDGTYVEGYYIASNGAVTQGAMGINTYSSAIKVIEGNIYTFSGIAGYTSSSNRIHGYSGTSTTDWVQQIDVFSTTDGNSYSDTFTIPNGVSYIRISQTLSLNSNIQLELGSTATTYQAYYDGGTATAEMMLNVGNYQDVQSIIDGVVTRKVGVKVLDGTENWAENIAGNAFVANATSTWGAVAGLGGFCTHLTVLKSGETTFAGACRFAIDFNVYKYKTAFGVNDIPGFKQYLAAQYNAGTPVIVLYPLATPTTESVAGQTLAIQQGANTFDITQASLSNLEIEVDYKGI